MVSFGRRLAGILALGFQLAQSLTELSSQSQKHLREVADALPADSTLRRALQNGAHGGGIHYSWMDEMKRGGVKMRKVRNSPYVVLRPKVFENRVNHVLHKL